MSRRVPIFLVVILVLASSATASEKPWTEVRSAHFRVLTNSSQNDARHIAREFEQMRAVFANRYPTFRLEGGAPLLILAARDEDSAKSLEPGIWKTKGVKPAGVFHHAWEREYVMVRMDEWNQAGREQEAREVAYHEYTHSILHLNLHWIPNWLDEGLANYYGYTRFQGSKIYIGAPPSNSRAMPGAPLIPIETLISVDQSSPYYHSEDKVYQFYAESWALVHFMIWGPGMDDGKRLNKFAGLLQQGIEQKKAFQQAFGSFADMDKALENYLLKFRFQTGVLSNPPQVDEKSFTSRTLSLAETKAELSGFHLWTHDPSGARSLAEQAIKDDPKVGLSHEVLGFANFNEGKDAEALSEFSQAYALDPTLSLSLFAKTMMSPLATSNVPSDQDVLHDALTKVVGLNSEFAPAYVQLARLAWRRNDPQLAYQLSRKAEQLEPTRAGYHLQSGQFLLHMGKGADAAVFAKYVADRWPGPDHDEAVELWDAIPPDQRSVAGSPTGASLATTQIEDAWIQATQIKDTPIMQGRLTEVSCSPTGHSSPEPGMIFTITHDGKSSRFRRTGPFGAGFSDTIWYGEDHFSFCHHLEGMRAVIHYKPSADPGYDGDVAEVDIRDDLPEPLPKALAAASASAPQ
jgi:tetratricopeptide (TPR) repeat protein